MKKISDWFKRYFEFKDEDEPKITKFTIEEEEERKFKFSKPLIPDDDEGEQARQVFYTRVDSTHQDKKKDDDYQYETTEVISPFFGRQGKATEEQVSKEKPKRTPKVAKKAEVISPFFGKVNQEKEHKKTHQKTGAHAKKSDIQLNFEDISDDQPDNFDELREWYKDEK